MKKIFTAILSLFIVLGLFVGCGNQNTDTTDDLKEKDQNEVEVVKELEEEEIEEVEEESNLEEDIDLSLKPNEAGEIMVLMYHGIGEEESEWVRSVENFKKDLQVLYDKGYRPISLQDFVNNNIDVEAGFTPVVITFDDGNKNNFNIIEKDGEKIVDPNSAVRIMEEFHEKHPDFPLKATFFIFGTNPFRQKELVEYKLKYLVDKGFDIGNHTMAHNDMSSKANQDPDKIQEYIAKEVEFINTILPEYDVNTYALCNGGRPKDELEKYLEQGEYNDVEYKNIAILNVGARPSVSPIDRDFNPLSIKRVRASETNVGNLGMYSYIEGFDKNPEKKFISDGDPEVVTVPKKFEEKVDKDKVEDKYLYIYE
ncbi:polysaccharide deacetylase family protein [Clostridiisalibacter paucivorans]|uniref:polysaccharide deacetylase family protein n=1 Tax=Clostridiisalibacter paucivorans TaxID=408753 RepID=UPI000688396C|nr:polysaccharide deacetylase family protein [Clostridiisalibacter paucivorans]